jgi:hypothetical protein
MWKREWFLYNIHSFIQQMFTQQIGSILVNCMTNSLTSKGQTPHAWRIENVRTMQSPGPRVQTLKPTASWATHSLAWDFKYNKVKDTLSGINLWVMLFLI